MVVGKRGTSSNPYTNPIPEEGVTVYLVWLFRYSALRIIETWGDNYCWPVLSTITKVTVRTQRKKTSLSQQKRIRKRIMILQQDNARSAAKITQEKIKQLGWELLLHPPYSPDLAPSDYHHFLSDVQTHLELYFESRPGQKVHFSRGGLNVCRNDGNKSSQTTVITQTIKK